MIKPNPAVFDPNKSADANVAAGIFRLCEAVEGLGAKLDKISSQLDTLRHAVGAGKSTFKSP